MLDLFNKKKLKEKETIIETKRKKITELLDTIDNLTEQNTRIITNGEHLAEENRKLIDWIEKIINEVGVKTKDSYPGKTIIIPYCEEIKPYKAYENDYIPKQERKDIIIPSIRFTKFRYKED